MTNTEEHVLRAIEILKPHGGLVLIADLRKALPYSKVIVSRTLLSLAEKQAISLQRHNHTARMTREEKKQALRDPVTGGYYIGVALRNPGRKHLPKASDKDQRRYEHIRDSLMKKKTNKKTAKRIAAATVRKAQAKRRAGNTRKAKNKTIIKAKRIDHLDVSKVHNPRKRVRIRNRYVDLKIAGKAKSTVKDGVKGWLVARRFYPVSRGTRKLTSGNSYLDLATGYVYRKATRNPKPMAKARTIREQFTGTKATKTAVMNAPKGTPGVLAKLGKLISIKTAKGLIKPSHKNPAGVVWLCSDSNGKLHLVTAAETLIEGPPRSFGQVDEVEYEAIKPHLGHKRPTIFFHKLGEESGIRPELVADGAGGLKFKGGNYRIGPEGIID